MYAIEKANETMTAKERVKRTFEYEKTDRVMVVVCTFFSYSSLRCTTSGAAAGGCTTHSLMGLLS